MKQERNKVKIFEFDPQIYPRKLWIVVGGEFADIRDEFEEISPLAPHAVAETCITRRITANPEIEIYAGILVRFEDLDAMSLDIMVHEATHVALDIFDYIGATVDGVHQEPLAYLEGWVGRCMDQVKTELLLEEKLKNKQTHQSTKNKKSKPESPKKETHE